MSFAAPTSPRRLRGDAGAGIARGRGDSGAALVEFALVLLPLAIIVFGIIDLGRAYSIQDRLTNSAREASAVLAYSPTHLSCTDGTSATERARAEDNLGGDASYAGITVDLIKAGATTSTRIYTEPAASCDTLTGANAPVAGDTVVVTTKYNFGLITPLVGRITGNPIVMKRTASMVVQG